MERGWRGFYFNGVTATRQPVDVSLTFDGVRITFADGTHKDWRIADLRQTQGSFSSEQRRFEYGSDPAEALVVEDRDFVIALSSAFPEKRLKSRDTHRTRRLAFWGISTLVAAAIGFLVFAGPGAAWLAGRVRPEWEARLGEGVGESLAPESRRCTDSTAIAALRTILDRLTAAEPSP